MIFNVISDKPVFNPFVSPYASRSLILTFERCVTLYPDADYFSNKVVGNVYWTEDIDNFIIEFLNKEFYSYNISPLITLNEFDFDFIIEIENEILCLKGKKIYIVDRNIATYFKEEIQFESSKNKFEVLIKSIGMLNDNYQLMIEKLKQYFKQDYKYYIPIIYNLIKNEKIVYTPSSFDDILFAKSYLEKVKIYNVESDFKLKKDKKGLYFICEDYTEFLTGRLTQKGESLQTLPKENRNVLVSEKDCFLIEFDFDAFEFNILLDILGISKTIDPHQDIIDYLGLTVNRDIGKSINYAYLYGMSPERICETMQEERDIHIDINKLIEYPLFKKKLIIDSYDGIIYTYFGRPIKIEKEWASLNNFIQGTTADIFFKKFRKITSILPNDDLNKIILQNHDSILIQLHKDIINNTDIANQIYSIFQESIKIFTFSVGVKYGKKWSELN